MTPVIVGMDPHKRSATIEIIDERETVLHAGRFGTDQDGYHRMPATGRRHAQRVWAVEGCQGIGRHLAQRLVADGETILGFDDVSVEAVASHEYGHEVDFAHENYPPNESSEMGPDAYGGYFVAHPKGFGWNARTQQEVTYMDASIDDCCHSHGTPDQRKAAVQQVSK